MIDINTILSWFKTGLKPTQAQFWASWQSFWHKDEQIPQSNIANLSTTLNAKAEKSQFEGHKIDDDAHANLFDKKVDKEEGKSLISNAEIIRLAAVSNALIATDDETQIESEIFEDNKLISRLKLFNWWKWIKSVPLKWENTITTAAGTSIAPPLVITNGTLTTVPVNGAIERDTAGKIYHTYSSVRKRLLDDTDTANFLQTTYRTVTEKSVGFISSNYVDITKTTSSSAIPATAFGSTTSGLYLLKTTDVYLIKNGSYDKDKFIPVKVVYEFFMRGIDCNFSGVDKIKLYGVERTDLNANESIRSYEIPIVVTRGLGSSWYSIISFEEKVFGNTGNILNSSHRKYDLKTNTGNEGIEFANAQITFEVSVSIFYSDPTNANNLNSSAKPRNTNLSIALIKL